MPLLPKASSFFRSLLACRNRDRLLDEELESYVEHLAEKKVRAGLNPQEARRQALIKLGGLEPVKEKIRERRIGHGFDTLLQDIRYGARMLRKNPGFTAVAVLTLALGIGANTAIFTVINGFLLHGLPYPDVDRIVQLWESDPSKGWRFHAFSPVNLIHLKQQNHIFERIAAIRYQRFNFTSEGEPEILGGASASSEFFQVMGVEPFVGRAFRLEEEVAGQVVVISYDLWQRCFRGRPEVLGKVISLDGIPHEVIGVMPRFFHYPPLADLWTPLSFSAGPNSREIQSLPVLARLKPEITFVRAQAEMEIISGRIRQRSPEAYPGWHIEITRLEEELLGDLRPTLYILFGVAAFFLLMTSANIANLQLVRADKRRQEFAIRAALGAGLPRLVRQVLAESLLLAVLGGTIGLLFSLWCLSLLLAIIPDYLLRLAAVPIDTRVLGFTFLVSFLVGVLSSLAPLLATSQLDLNAVLKESPRMLSSRTGQRTVRNSLVTLQIASTLLLTIGAVLVVGSFVRLSAIGPGFDPAGILTLDISLPRLRYREPHQIVDFYNTLLQRIEFLPNVKAAGTTTAIPITGTFMYDVLSVEGYPSTNSQGFDRAFGDVVSPNYFRALGIPLLKGRYFTERDSVDAPPVIIINQALAQRFWADKDPIGKQARFGDDDSPWRTVIGVVGNVRQFRLDRIVVPQVYLPYQQRSERTMTLVTRTMDDSMGIVTAVKRQVWAIDKDQAVTNVQTMERVLSGSIVLRWVVAQFLGTFALVAFVQAMVGIYGVLSYSVGRRTHEIGVRMALGAQRGDILKLVVGQGMALVGVGLVIGLLATYWLTRFVKSFLFEVEPTDPATFVAVSLVLSAVALLACYVPARRAMHVNPMEALRYE